METFHLQMNVVFFSGKKKKTLCLINEKYYAHLLIFGDEDNEYLEVNFINGPDPVPFDMEISVDALTIDEDAHYEKLTEGTKFFIYEGPKVVGKGTITGIQMLMRRRIKRYRRLRR